MHLTKKTRSTFAIGLATLGLLLAAQVQALEFRSVAAGKAVLYDAPSTEAKKLYLISSGYPVEIIVNLGEWIKIRDHFGTLSWVQSKQLSAKRTALIVGEQAELKQADEDNAPLVATLEKDVVVDVVAAPAKSGWIKVKHRDGLTGFVHSTAVWGN